MHALVIVHEHDVAQLQAIAVEGAPEPRLSPHIFHPPHTFDLSVFSARHTKAVELLKEPKVVLRPSEILLRYSTLVLLEGEHAASGREIVELLRDFLAGYDAPIKTLNPAIIVVKLSEHRRPLSLPIERVFFVPSGSEGATSTIGSPSWIAEVADEITERLTSVEENQSLNPNVGVGLLLLDKQGEFFLMQRQRQPGRGMLATVGGSFYRGQTIEEGFEDIFQRRFQPPSERARPIVQIGPLLACTNMKDGFHHYVDLTFLGILKKGDLKCVSDPGLISLGDEALSRALDYPPGGGRRVTFTLTEMATFFERGMLFPPVANAFQSFCRRLLAFQLKSGREQDLRLPSLSGTESLKVPRLDAASIGRIAAFSGIGAIWLFLFLRVVFNEAPGGRPQPN
jgi:hypothetical protein